MEYCDDSHRLGRRPVQGPRSSSGNQGRDEKLVTGRTSTLQLRKNLRLATWNIRSLVEIGKVHVLGREMERRKVNVCGLSEVRWAGQGHFTTLEGHTIVYAGESNQQGQRRVAVWLHKNIAGAIIGYEPVSSRIIKVRLTAKPRNVTMVQAYGPTSVSVEADIGEFYEDLSKAVKSVSRKDILVVTGDFNAKLGMEESAATGRFGLGQSNDAGNRLREFFIEHELIVANTIFHHHPRRRYTWISPDGQSRNLID